MSMRDFMQDLMRTRNASEVRIVHDASVASIPDDHDEDDPLMGGSDDAILYGSSDRTDDYAVHRRSVGSFSLSSNPSTHSTSILVLGIADPDLDCVSHHTTRSYNTYMSPNLDRYRERHRKIKETLSPVKIVRYSKGEAVYASQTTPSQQQDDVDVITPQASLVGGHRIHRRDNLRSRLIRLASDPQIALGLTEDAI